MLSGFRLVNRAISKVGSLKSTPIVTDLLKVEVSIGLTKRPKIDDTAAVEGL